MKAVLEKLGFLYPVVFAYTVWIAARLGLRRLRVGRPLLVLLRAAGLGDVIGSLPSVGALRQQYPERWIIYCTRPEFQALPELMPAVDQVIGVFQTKALARLLRRFCDARIFSYDDELPGRASQRHFVEEMAESVGVRSPIGQPSLPVAPLSPAEFRRLVGFDRPTGLLVAVHMGPTAPVREWPQAHWQTLVDKLVSEWDATILRIGGNRHLVHGASDSEPIPQVHVPPVALSIIETARVLQSCDLFIGVDSGPLHLAAAVGTQVAGLFGPVNPRLRAPQNALVLQLAEALPCQFCHHHIPRRHWDADCPHDRACLRTLHPEAVFAQLEAWKTASVAMTR